MNEQAMEVFSYEGGQDVRTQIDQGGEPWFVAKDVCKILEISNSRDAVSSLDDDEKGVVNADTLGGVQKMNAVNESGLYALIFKSRKPEAKRFRKWVTSEVLPQIRKTGSYSVGSKVQGMSALDMFRTSLQVFEEQNKRLDKVESRLVQVEEQTGYVPDKTQRTILNEIVRGSVSGVSKDGYSQAIRRNWNELYSEFLARFSINIRIKAKNKGMDNLEWSQAYGQMENLIKLARLMYEE